MTKKHFIELADVLKRLKSKDQALNDTQLSALADFCYKQNPAFKRNRWLGYIEGVCGPNGGKRE